MKQIIRFFYWYLKTLVALLFLWVGSLIALLPFLPTADSEPRSSILGYYALILSVSTFLISWHMEYRGGKKKYQKWFEDRLFEKFQIGFSPHLRETADNLIKNATYTESEVQQFKIALQKEGLPPKKEKKFLLNCLNQVFKEFSQDRKLDDSEWQTFLDSRKAFDCSIPHTSSTGVSAKRIGDYRARGIVSEGRLIEFPKDRLPVKAQDNETVFLVIAAHFVKRRIVTKRVNYSGFSKSVNIGMGIRYRVGTIRPQSIKQEVVAIEDTGYLYITSERIGFHGDRKSWSAGIKTINDVQVESDVGLEIFKNGRENPILIYPNDLDFSAAVLDIVLNGNYTIDDNKIAV